MTRSTEPPSLTRPKGRDYDPYEHADALGIQVLYRPLRASNELWLPDYKTIIVESSLRAVHRRNVLAHGVAHAALGHVDDRPKHEVQADRYAAENLIDLDECRQLMRWTPDAARLAAELEVTGRVLRVFLNVHRLAG